MQFDKLKLLNHPLNDFLIKKELIKEEILKKQTSFVPIKIAIMAGSTVEEIVDNLELFLLASGIKPTFYVTKFNDFFNESITISKQLKDFKPDIVFYHTNWRNLFSLPKPSLSRDSIEKSLLDNQTRFLNMWENISQTFNCTIIQNNFDYCYFRVLGNMDSYDYHGINNFIARMNIFLSEKAVTTRNLFINDLNYLQAKYGINDFSDPKYWFLYKYAINVRFIPIFSFNLANIIKSILGKNKKVINLDLDNTLWGGIIGDDGIEGIKISQGDPVGEYYQEFQHYLKSLKETGVLLTINSKNDSKNAHLGLSHPDSILLENDFVDIQSNWLPKNVNLSTTAKLLNLGIDSFVFVDDNPVERQIIKDSFDCVDVIDYVDNAIYGIDFLSPFECTFLSEDDFQRTNYYRNDLERKKSENSFLDYNDFLKSLDMESEIQYFKELYFDRITQLINKTNQFNLTTNRLTKEQVVSLSGDNASVCLFAKLKDKFGDNGLVSCIIGEKQDEKTISITNWVMSCRVFSRGLENALMNEFVKEAIKLGYSKIVGTYAKTKKNSLVEHLYQNYGFIHSDLLPNVYEINVSDYSPKKHFIRIKR